MEVLLEPMDGPQVLPLFPVAVATHHYCMLQGAGLSLALRDMLEELVGTERKNC